MMVVVLAVDLVQSPMVCGEAVNLQFLYSMSYSMCLPFPCQQLEDGIPTLGEEAASSAAASGVEEMTFCVRTLGESQ